MKGCKQHKRYIAKWRKHLKRIHFDDLLIFQFERCKKWYNRQQFKKEIEND